MSIKRVLLLFLFPIALIGLSFDKGLDVSVSLDPLNFEKGSRVDISHQAFLNTERHTFLINPRMCAYFDTHVDVSFGLGHRILIGESILGYHAFYDYSKHSPMYFHQTGWSLEYLGKHLDYRINCYHPIVSKQIIDRVEYHPHHWVEGEVSLKTNRFILSLGPVYNFSTESPAAKLRMTIPYRKFSLGAGIECDRNLNMKSFLSLGCQLYNLPSGKAGKGALRTNRVRFSSYEIPYVPPAPVMTESKEKKIDGAYYIKLNKDYVLYSELNVYVKDGPFHKPFTVHTQEELESLREVYGEEGVYVPVDQIGIRYVTDQQPEDEEIPAHEEDGSFYSPVDPGPSYPQPQEEVQEAPEPQDTGWWNWLFGFNQKWHSRGRAY